MLPVQYLFEIKCYNTVVDNAVITNYVILIHAVYKFVC